jgi:hypothetical protein
MGLKENLLLPKRYRGIFLLETKRYFSNAAKSDVQQGAPGSDGLQNP